jgi:hypothetical protein
MGPPRRGAFTINHVAAQRFHIFSTGKIGNSGVIAARLFAPIAATDKLTLQRYI